MLRGWDPAVLRFDQGFIPVGISRAAVYLVKIFRRTRSINDPNRACRKVFNAVRGMGAEIIEAKGRTHYGIATCVCSLADAVLNQRLTIAPVTSTLTGEYGIKDVAISVPSIVGVNGVERRLEEKLSEEEYGKLKISADKMRETLESMA